MSENYFTELYDIDVRKKVKKKDKLNYLSWAAAWAEVKKIHPDATYRIYERTTPDGYIVNYFTDGKTCWVKTGVTICGIEHIEELACMNFRNQSIKLEDITSTDVNKAVQRSLTKACARHGLGLYIYEGEDLPEKEKDKLEEESKVLKKKINDLIKAMGDAIEKGVAKEKVYAVIAKNDGGNKNPNNIKFVEVCDACIAEITKKTKEAKA